jgi:hypothetical protein
MWHLHVFRADIDRDRAAARGSIESCFFLSSGLPTTFWVIFPKWCVLVNCLIAVNITRSRPISCFIFLVCFLSLDRFRCVPTYFDHPVFDFHLPSPSVRVVRLQPQNEYIELHQKRFGRRLDHEERTRKRAAREVHRRSEIAQKLTGIRAKLYNKKRYAEKAEMKRTYVTVGCHVICTHSGGSSFVTCMFECW